MQRSRHVAQLLIPFVIYSFVNILTFSGKHNKEFNMRHDWNSLLSDDETLLMTHYSKEFFPNADDLVSFP